ncbi:hypothetical protein KR018_008103, partial [Drosophila ironensis]
YFRTTMLSRASFFYARASLMKCSFSDQRIPYRRRPVVELKPRRTTAIDLRRPPFLLVKSFLNLQHLYAGSEGEHVSQVTEALRFRPHRTLLIYCTRQAGGARAPLTDSKHSGSTPLDSIRP